MNPYLDELKSAVKFYNEWKEPEVREVAEVLKHRKVLLSTAQSVIEGRLVPKGNTPAEGMIYGMDSKYSKPTLTEEELERILPKKKVEYEDYNPDSNAESNWGVGYNQAITDSKYLILKHLRGE